MEEKRGFQMEKLMPYIMIFLCVCVLCRTILIYKGTPTGTSISATGSASVDFESDLIVWRGSFQVHGETLEKAYEKIRTDGILIRQYLEKQGIGEDEMLFGSVDIRQNTSAVYDKNGNFLRNEKDGYDLKQVFAVSSDDLDKVAMVSRDISQLIASGVELESQNPEYYSTRLDEVKMELVEAATANARQRIERMAEQSGARLGGLTTASLGVFQITALNSGTADYGATGTLDTTSRYKTAMITVKLNYKVR